MGEAGHLLDAAAMLAEAQAATGLSHGKFQYSTTLLTDIGENLEALHEEFRPFRERFGVEVENRG